MVITLPHSVLHAYSCPVHVPCVTWPPSSTPEPWHGSATLQPNPSLFLSLGWSSPNFIIALNSSQRDTLKMLTLWEPLYRVPTSCREKYSSCPYTGLRLSMVALCLLPLSYIHSIAQPRTSVVCYRKYAPCSSHSSAYQHAPRAPDHQGTWRQETLDTLLRPDDSMLAQGLTWPSPTYRTAILWVS